MPIRPENRDRYPANWREIRARVLERAWSPSQWNQSRGWIGASQCECHGECGRGHEIRCQAFDGEPHPDTGSKVVLTVAHLDHQPENCGMGNLRAMCQACRLAYDAEHHAEQRARNRVLELEALGQRRLFE